MNITKSKLRLSNYQWVVTVACLFGVNLMCFIEIIMLICGMVLWHGTSVSWCIRNWASTRRSHIHCCI